MRLSVDLRIDANKPIKNDMETQAVSGAPASIAITLSSNQPDDKNHSQIQLNDDKKRAGKLQ